MIITVTNLYPYPAQPTRGLFNLQLFRELADITPVRNVVLVAGKSQAHSWQSPAGVMAAEYLGYSHLPLIGRYFDCVAVASTWRKNIVVDEGCHAILASWLYPDGCGVARATQQAGVPVWIMVLGTDRFHLRDPIRRRMILVADKAVAGYICVSRNIADDIVAAGLPRDKVHVVANGVDTARFYPQEKSDAISRMDADLADIFKQARLNLLWVGNLIPIKAPDVALKAFARLKNERANLIFVGDGPMLNSLRAQALRLGVEKSVHFVGRRSHIQMPLLLNAVDLLLLSSLSEGMPNAVTEALACGTPVVATDVGACQEMLRAQPCCRLVAPGDSDAMAQAVEAVLVEAEQHPQRPSFERTWHDMAEDVVSLMTNARNVARYA